MVWESGIGNSGLGRSRWPLDWRLEHTFNIVLKTALSSPIIISSEYPFVSMSRFTIFVLCFLSSLVPYAAKGQGLTFDAAAETSEPSAEQLARCKVDLQAALELLRGHLKSVTIASYSYRLGKYDEAEEWSKQFEAAMAGGRAQKDRIIELTYTLFRFSPDLDQEILDLGASMIEGLFNDHQYEMTYQIARRVVESNPDEKVELYLMRTALLTNRFDEALKYRDKLAASVPKLPLPEVAMLQGLPFLIQMQEGEKQLDDVSSQKDALPQVAIETDAGRIVVELYEDQYPDTVGHFVSLVEKGHYDHLVFHRVTKNIFHFGIAQTGILEMTLDEQTKQIVEARPRRVEYLIHDETPVGGIERHHLRGVLSLVARQDEDGKKVPNSGGPEFLITLVPIPNLDAIQVPFGRVISGLEVIDKIRTNITASEKDGKETPMEQPGFTILRKATVLKKRDHEYKPNPALFAGPRPVDGE